MLLRPPSKEMRDLHIKSAADANTRVLITAETEINIPWTYLACGTEDVRTLLRGKPFPPTVLQLRAWDIHTGKKLGTASCPVANEEAAYAAIAQFRNQYPSSLFPFLAAK